SIQRLNMSNEFLVPSANQDTTYIVSSEIGICTCPAGRSGAPCKHQDRENFNKAKMRTPISDSAIETNENAYNNNETNIVVFMDFLNEVKEDYQNANPQLSAKNQSILCLTSYLYDLNSGADSTTHIRSGFMIRVQVESVKRCKTDGSGRK
ncbi:23568_t:CDS:2, partial [Racocetra persica]